MKTMRETRPDILEKKFWRKILFWRFLNKNKFIKSQDLYINQLLETKRLRMDLMSDMIEHKADRNRQLDLYLQVGSPNLIEKHKLT